MSNDSQNPTKPKLTKGGEKLIEILLDPRNRTKSITDVCKLAELSRTTYYVLFSDPVWLEEYKRQSKEMITQNISGIINTFINEAKRGSFQHGKIVLEMAGVYVEKTEANVILTMPPIILGKE